MSSKKIARPKDPCPCGSGKKYKKCHGKDVLKKRVYKGRSAEVKITNRLKGHASALAISVEIVGFYGSALRYSECISFENSNYNLDMINDPISLKSATVGIKLGTNRVVESICHELLHLNLYIKGFPTGHIVNIPDELNMYAEKILGYYSKVTNLIQHEITVGQFLDLGYKKENFLSRHSPAPNYEEMANRATPSQGYIKEIGFSYWCLEYLRHWISSRHGVGEKSIEDAENALRWGSTIHPGIEQTFEEIQKHIVSGRINSASLYGEELNKLLVLMGLPPFTSWAILSPGTENSPNVTRLDV